MELRDDLGGLQCHIEDVENDLERVLLNEDGQSQVDEALSLVDKVECYQLITFLHVFVLDDLLSIDESTDDVGWSRKLEEILVAWHTVVPEFEEIYVLGDTFIGPCKRGTVLHNARVVLSAFLFQKFYVVLESLVDSISLLVPSLDFLLWVGLGWRSMAGNGIIL